MAPAKKPASQVTKVRQRRNEQTAANNKGWRERFIKALSTKPNITAACIKARVAQNTVFKERRQKPEFAAKWDEAIKQGVEHLESVVWDRATKGVAHGVWRNDANGNPVKVETVHEFSDSLAVVLLKAHAPHKYKDTVRNELTGPDGQAMVVVIHSPVNPEDVTGPPPAKTKEEPDDAAAREGKT